MFNRALRLPPPLDREEKSVASKIRIANAAAHNPRNDKPDSGIGSFSHA